MAAHLELLAGIGVESAIVIENVDEVKVVALANFVIVRVMRGRDLDSTGTKLHVDDDGVSDDRYSAIHEWMEDEFAVQMLDDISYVT